MRRHSSVALVVTALMLSACGGAAIESTHPRDDGSPTTQAAVSTEAVETMDSVPADSTTTTLAMTSTTTSTSADSEETEESDSGGETRGSSGASTTSTTSPVRAETVPSTTVPTTAMRGEVPDDLMQRVLADAAGRTGAEASGITVMRSDAVVWNDGSLGCPQPGVAYTQEIIDGYWVELVVADDKLDYRINASGAYFLCQGDGPRP